MQEVTGDVIVVNSLGMHARPASALVQVTTSFESNIYLTFKGNQINAKSIMGLLTLGAARGSHLIVSCSGSDAEQAFAAVTEIFASGFGEE
ncbi:MAG: HPr family phosphocarrier protein [Candidatus Hydrogenedentes bacterium]|nr:HPr family phosphocarrier protein [Candidatus Hydrogenedentota bacterium]